MKVWQKENADANFICMDQDRTEKGFWTDFSHSMRKLRQNVDICMFNEESGSFEVEFNLRQPVLPYHIYCGGNELTPGTSAVVGS